MALLNEAKKIKSYPFKMGKWPEGRRNEIFYLSGLKDDLKRYVEEFAAALDLQQHCQDVLNTCNSCNKMEENHRYFYWREFAQKNAIISLYNFKEAMKAITTAIHQYNLDTVVRDSSLFESAKKKFKSAFPNAEELRHTISHSAELKKTAKETKMNSFSGNNNIGGVLITGDSNNIRVSVRSANSFTDTKSGKIHKINLNNNDLETLKTILLEFYSGFDSSNYIGSSNH